MSRVRQYCTRTHTHTREYNSFSSLILIKAHFTIGTALFHRHSIIHGWITVHILNLHLYCSRRFRPQTLNSIRYHVGFDENEFIYYILYVFLYSVHRIPSAIQNTLIRMKSFMCLLLPRRCDVYGFCVMKRCVAAVWGSKRITHNPSFWSNYVLWKNFGMTCARRVTATKMELMRRTMHANRNRWLETGVGEYRLLKKNKRFAQDVSKNIPVWRMASGGNIGKRDRPVLWAQSIFAQRRVCERCACDRMTLNLTNEHIAT